MEDWLKALPWKDWGAAIIGGLFAIGSVTLTIVSKVSESNRQHKLQRETHEREQAAEERKSEHQSDVAQTQDLTDRFKALMDGYEGRIRDLTNEMTTMRQEMRELRQQFESHQRICRGCPHFDERMTRFARS